MRPFYRDESDRIRAPEFPGLALKQRDRGRSVATPPGTSRRTWSRQSVTSILCHVSFLFPSLPSLCLLHVLTSGCLRVFMPSFFYLSTPQEGVGMLSVFRIYPCLFVPLRERHWDMVARRWRRQFKVFSVYESRRYLSLLKVNRFLNCKKRQRCFFKFFPPLSSEG